MKTANPNVEVVREDLRALLFWAAVGVKASRGGAYEEEIVNIIDSYAAWLNFDVGKVVFNKKRPKRRNQ